MKQKIIKILTTLFIAVVVLSSCDSYLELKPKDNLVQEEFWQNKEQVSSALKGCYASMTQSAFTQRLLLWGELRGEMMVSAGGASGDASRMMLNNMSSSNGLVNWSSFYATINYCNLLLDYTDSAQEKDLSFTQAEADRFKAEAITIRSMVYLILVKNFKEVPLVLTGTSSNQIEFYIPKSSEEDILEQIIADLVGAVDKLNKGHIESPAHDKGQITQGAALAILADAYLWSNQYDNCIDACQDIIDLGKYNLVTPDKWFSDMFFEGNSNEGIFELQFSNDNATLRNYFEFFNADYQPYGGIVDLYEEFPNDVRANNATYGFLGSKVFKYAGINDFGEYREFDEFLNTFILYRYADVLLMQAEAYALSTDRQDLGKAFFNLNEVHLRGTGAAATTALTRSSLLSDLLLERQKEFAFEGKRWYDLLRFARRNDFIDQQIILDLADVKASADNYALILSFYSDVESYYFPILEDELDRNYNLVQNPFYEN